MTLDISTVRVLSRITDRLDLIRKHPRRYDVAPDDLAMIRNRAEEFERLLEHIKVIKVG